MGRLLDVAYVAAGLVTTPIWGSSLIRRGRAARDWAGRLGRVAAAIDDSRPTILLHAVSVGEVNAIRHLVGRLESDEPTVQIVIASTTETGLERALSLFAPKHPVVRYPLDFSGAVRRFLEAVKPDVVGLVELEVWPHFTEACQRRGIRVGVINGRLSSRSFRRYRMARPLIAPSFRRLDFVAAQSQVYAERFLALGADPRCVSVTGTMKWDSARLDVDLTAAASLAEQMGIDRGSPLVVAGSTAPGEPELLMRSVPPGVQLLCAPRRPEWFDPAAAALHPCARRSTGERGSPSGRFLLDTVGELQHAYALADLVVVGRSFGRLHGSDMMEPLALGKPTVVGPAVSDFQETVDVLLDADGLVQTTAEALPTVISDLLGDPQRRTQLVANAREAIRQRQGATERHCEILTSFIAANGARRDEQEIPQQISPSRETRDGEGGERRKEVNGAS